MEVSCCDEWFGNDAGLQSSQKGASDLCVGALPQMLCDSDADGSLWFIDFFQWVSVGFKLRFPETDLLVIESSLLICHSAEGLWHGRWMLSHFLVSKTLVDSREFMEITWAAVEGQ